jgi:hypothetical protein
MQKQKMVKVCVMLTWFRAATTLQVAIAIESAVESISVSAVGALGLNIIIWFATEPAAVTKRNVI